MPRPDAPDALESALGWLVVASAAFLLFYPVLDWLTLGHPEYLFGVPLPGWRHRLFMGE